MERSTARAMYRHGAGKPVRKVPFFPWCSGKQNLDQRTQGLLPVYRDSSQEVSAVEGLWTVG